MNSNIRTARSSFEKLTHSPVAGHALIGLIFLGLGFAFVWANITPVHDAIGWFGVFHYFYASVARGIIPFWNPYAMAGVPFYPNFQLFGLWEPSNYLFACLYKWTGCSTLTAYLFHYLFYYFVFVAGAYNAIRAIVKRNDIGLLFSLILLLGVFPAFMHQNGAVHFVWMAPLFTYFVVLSLDEREIDRRGFYLYCAVSVFAVACLTYIPSGMIFYLFWFVIFAAGLKIIRAKDAREMAVRLRGIPWIGVSALTLVLILSPVAALYLDSTINNELFPLVRLQFSALHFLPKLFVSDLRMDLFSQQLIATQSITWGNIVGLFLEPWPAIIRVPLVPSEIMMYLGVLPMVCIFVSAGKAVSMRNPYARLFLMMAAVTLLVMSNLKNVSSDPLSLFQRLLILVVPALNRVEVFENFGALFAFCLMIAAAVGFKKTLDSRNKTVWLVSLSLLFARYFLAFPFFGFKEEALHAVRRLIPGTGLPDNSVMWIYVCLLAIAGVPAAKRIMKFPLEKIKGISVLLLFLDLFCFDGVHIYNGVVNGIGFGPVLTKTFYSVLKKEHAFQRGTEDQFIDYRKPFIEEKPGCIDTFWGHEILTGRKIAMPALMNSYFQGCTSVDSTFSTQSYYDYLVHVGLDKQLAISGIIYPIVNFYASRDAVPGLDKYDVVLRINRTTPRELGRRVFLESDSGNAPRTSVDYSHLLDPGNYLRLSRDELIAFEREKGERFAGNLGSNLQVTRFDPNSLFVSVNNSEAGYLYFSDGYSKHWKAFLDDREVPIERANINFKSIYLPAGNHRVAFLYDPRYIRYAMYASVVGCFGALLLITIYSIRLLPRARAKGST